MPTAASRFAAATRQKPSTLITPGIRNIAPTRKIHSIAMNTPNSTVAG